MITVSCPECIKGTMKKVRNEVKPETFVLEALIACDQCSWQTRIDSAAMQDAQDLYGDDAPSTIIKENHNTWKKSLE